MTTPAAPPVGLYSIGIRDLDLSAILTLAAAEQIPFLHVRGGPKGYDLARCSHARLSAWARQARDGVPVTMVTADLDLAAFGQPAAPASRGARAGLERLAEAARVLGASSVRLLACHPPACPGRGSLAIPDLSARHELTTLVELHHRAWFTTRGRAVLHALLDGAPAAGVLLDSAQFHTACPGVGPVTWLPALARQARALHLSDTGSGLAGSGHRLAARAVGSAIATGQAAEVAFEWTGPDRSPGRCLARYRAACAWWQHAGAGR